MRASEQLKAFLEGWERYEKMPYPDGFGFMTVGIGHQIKDGEDFTGGLSLDDARALLEEDLTERAEALDRLLQGGNQQQFDALLSFAFNIGLDRFRNSTALRRHNAGDPTGAADAMLLWDKAHQNGNLVVVAGLVKRRRAERQVYLRGDYSGRP